MSKLFISFAACAFILINNHSIHHSLHFHKPNSFREPFNLLLIVNFIEHLQKLKIDNFSICSDEFIVILFALSKILL